MSKYYGESERLLGKVFSLANELPNGAIIFLDEVTEAFIAYTMTFYIFVQ
jgi:ATP-dependent 26S proteasome regulatory subunit